MDVYVAHEALYRGVPVAMTMERALTAPTDTLIRLSSGYIDWTFLDVDTNHPGYDTIERMVQQIRAALTGASRCGRWCDGRERKPGVY